MKKLNFLLIVIILLSVSVFAQNPGMIGVDGLLHTQTGRNIEKGQLGLVSNMNFFTKLGEFIGDASLKPADFSAANYWLVAGNFGLTYGILDNLDMTAYIRVYQDTHYKNEFNLPDDIFINLKTGSYRFGENRFYSSFMTSFRIPTGEVHNYPFAEYASGQFSWGLMTALSYYVDPYLPERSLNFHLNLGYWNNNERGSKIEDVRGTEFLADRSSQHINLNFATVIPAGMVDLRFELSGIVYSTKPEGFIYSAEEWVFFTPSIRYKAMDWLAMDLGIDFKMSPEEDREWTTDAYPINAGVVDLPKNYTAWKVHLGLNMEIPLGGKSSKSLEDVEQEEFNKRVEFYQTVKQETEDAKKIEEELENLRKERESADKEIEELRRLLEED